MPTGSRDRGARLRGKAAAKLHLALAAGVSLGGSAFGLEVTRALGGHTLSWLYVFEWPFLIGCGVWMWWQLLHDTGREAGDVVTEPPVASAPDTELAAWQRYVRQMELDELRDPEYRV